MVWSEKSDGSSSGVASTRYSRMPNRTPSPIASVLLVCREPLTNTPFVLPRSSTASAPSALMATAACSRDRLGSSITKSAWGERPMVFRSPQTRIIDGRCESVGAGRRQALFTRTYETRSGCE